MDHFMLILITLNALTGDLLHVEQLGGAYESARSCLAAAADLGPQPRSEDRVKVLMCRSEQPRDAVEAPSGAQRT